MKELIKVVSKKLFIYSFFVNLLYSIADYGQSFALSIFGTSPLTLDKLTKLTIAMLVADVLMLVFGKIGSYIDNVNDAKANNDIEKYYFDKLQNMTMEKIQNTHTGFIHNLISETANLFVDVTYYFEISIVPLIIGVTSILFMVCKQSVLTGIVCILISALAVFLKYKMMKNKQKYDKEVRSKRSKYNATLIDFIQNIVAVRKLNIGRFCYRKIDENSEEYLKATKTNEVKRSNMNAVFTILMDLLYIIVLLSTIALVKNGVDGLPYLLFYITALGKIYSNLNCLVKFIDTCVRFKTSKEQLDEYFKDCKETKLIKDFKKLKLSEVVFSYTKDSTKIVIPEFTLEKGDKISIMGQSGQGKTTAMNILAGLYPLEEGKLTVNGKDKKDSRLDLVFVSQEVDLFDLSVRDNLCLGKNISEKRIVELLKEAGLYEWYTELPEGLETMVGERGVKLSAGQKQRLNLIRGILIDKDLYFFDEPTSNLDSESEEKITNMIEKYLKDKTYVIVTHRPRLKDLCNKHYVFEHHMMKEVINA